MTLTLFDFAIRIVFAIFFGFCIGLERQLTGHAAGIRINVLVSLGACIFVLFSIMMDAPDITRIAAQIVTGVGFICSGIIFKNGANVRGINTATTIWCTAAIGMLSSSGKIDYAFLATILLLASTVAFRVLGKHIHPLESFDESEKTYKVTVICTESQEIGVRSIVMENIKNSPLTLMNLESADMLGDKVEIEATLACGGRRFDQVAENLIEKISLEEGVSKIGWELISA